MELAVVAGGGSLEWCTVRDGSIVSTPLVARSGFCPAALDVGPFGLVLKNSKIGEVTDCQALVYGPGMCVTLTEFAPRSPASVLPKGFWKHANKEPYAESPDSSCLFCRPGLNNFRPQSSWSKIQSRATVPSSLPAVNRSPFRTQFVLDTRH